MFSLMWALLEWLRGWVFTGFPWNLAGMIWGFSDALLQAASVFGAYGLSLVTVMICSLGAICAYPVTKRMRLQIMGAGLGLIVLLWSFGAVRLQTAIEAVHEDVVLRLVQGNIAQKDKWDRGLQYQNFQDQLALSAAPPTNPSLNPTHIIWPETAVTYSLSREPNAVRALAAVAPHGGMVITGTPRMTPREHQPYQVWNSLMAVDYQGDIVGHYDKSHLVPFGEYMPLRDWNPFPKLTAGQVDFSAGAGVETMTLAGLPPFSPLICYEIIFPHAVVDADHRPQWLLNLTNDGWYGHSAGPYQHLMASRMRSIEEGLPLVRVAGTGVSAVTDAYGRIVAQIPYGVRAVVDVALPKALEVPPLAARFPKVIWWSFVLLVGGVAGMLLRRAKKLDRLS